RRRGGPAAPGANDRCRGRGTRGAWRTGRSQDEAIDPGRGIPHAVVLGRILGPSREAAARPPGSSMVKSKLDVMQWGTDRLRIGPWRGDARTAFLAPVAGRPASTATIDRCLDVLAAKGYRSVLTAALSRTEQEPF